MPLRRDSAHEAHTENSVAAMTARIPRTMTTRRLTPSTSNKDRYSTTASTDYAMKGRISAGKPPRPSSHASQWNPSRQEKAKESIIPSQLPSIGRGEPCENVAPKSLRDFEPTVRATR